jgi:GNAT superfamily N-acetyltransferase
MKLRFAKHSDLSECVDIGEKFWEHSPYADAFPYNAGAVLGLLTALIQGQFMLVAEHEEQIVAVAAVLVASSPFDPELRVATELFWYVDPETRGLGVGQLLMDGLEDLARTKGAKICSMGSMSTSDPKAAERLFKKSGYKLTEKTFTKVL